MSVRTVERTTALFAQPQQTNVRASEATILTTPPAKKTRDRARLNDCAFLIQVLECFMTNTIRENERQERHVRVQQQHAAFHPYAMSAPAVTEPSVFHALQPPSITPVDYLRRLARYSFCSRSVFVAAFFYLERIARIEHVDLRINSLSVHRLLLTAVLLATKMIDDVLYDNAHFAKVGGLDVKELNMLELDMLKVLRFKLFIQPEQFEMFEHHLLNCAMDNQDPEYCMLPSRLTSLGYVTTHHTKPPAPGSPASTMDVCFSAN